MSSMNDADRKWEVDPAHGFVDAGLYMKASCHHKTSGACGGCYARLMRALNEIEANGDWVTITKTLFESLRAEGAKFK